MKTTRLIFLALALAAPIAAKTDSAVVGRMHPEEGNGSGGHFGLGAARRTVVAIAGLPDERIGDSIWIYHRCSLSRDHPKTRGFDVMVVVFNADRVAAMKLTDGRALRNLLAQKELKVTGPSYADLLR